VIQRQAKDLSQRIQSIQDEERQRIAQELHDSTAQHLAAINLNLMALRSTNGPTEKAEALFADIQSSLVAAMNELRTFAHLLYPQELTRDGLVETLDRYIEGFSRRTGLLVKLRSGRNLDGLPQPLQHSLLRIVQESLANVHRHASASRVTVKLQRGDDYVHLLIADNGVGLKYTPTVGHEEDPALPLGVGIPGMAARARQLGGRLDVRSRSTGTLVHAVLPLEFEHGADTLRNVGVDMPKGAGRTSNERARMAVSGTASSKPSITLR
jgi:two-component system, NarL family, sensor kinase